MGNILLYTKHIEHTRGNTEQTGETIFQGFKDSREQLTHWSAYIEEMQLRSDSDSESALARLAAAHLADSIDRQNSGLAVLMEHAAIIDNEGYGQAVEIYSAYKEKLGGTLTGIGEGSGAFTEAERQAVNEVQSSFVSLTELLSAFHYEMEGIRESMFRLAGGHEWMDIADELQKALRDYTGS